MRSRKPTQENAPKTVLEDLSPTREWVPLIFIDSNIPMYLVGEAHPCKTQAQQFLERAILEQTALVTDAEVFQEILHRYTAIHRLDAVAPAFEALSRLADAVWSIDLEHVVRARDILLASPPGRGISARDALHVAVMQAHGVDQIATFDKGFDLFPTVRRLPA